MSISRIAPTTSTSSSGERGTDFLRWDMVAADPFAHVPTGPATYGGLNGRAAVLLANSAAGSIYTPYISIYGPKNTDGLLKTINVVTYVAMAAPNSTSSLNGYICSPDPATRFVINFTTTTWNIATPGGTASPTLTFGTWYRITQNYLPGTSCDLSYALATNSTDTLLGTTATSALNNIDMYVLGQAPFYVGRRTLRWG